MNSTTLETLQDLGVRDTTTRWYLWCCHFASTGSLNEARYFLEKLFYRRARLVDKGLGTWMRLSEAVSEMQYAEESGRHVASGGGR